MHVVGSLILQEVFRYPNVWNFSCISVSASFYLNICVQVLSSGNTYMLKTCKQRSSTYCLFRKRFAHCIKMDRHS